ncbi:MAG: Stealth CR1 domain-containing protein [Tidjanibacter sp.]|nr:Stealth CR1 domain-containing protein [Tidjanibacter sp.]
MQDKIDLVYLWVDGSDKEWIEKKRKALMAIDTISDSQPTAEARFVDNDELKYSLRSVEKFAPWINRVYIVTADQTPAWIDVNHPKLRMVSHSEILAPHHLPTFNSHAIEMSIPNIKGLSERFLLANDDTFIAKPIGPEFFYTPEGLPIARFARHISKRQSLYMTVVRRAQAAIEAIYGKRYVRTPHHNIDAYLKSDVVACNEEFAEWVERTRSAHFRTTHDLQRVVWLYWALAKGRAKMRIVRHYTATTGLWDRIKCLVQFRYKVDSRSFGIHGVSVERKFRKYNPTLFCLNDNERADDRDRKGMKDFLERMYPEKSSFEL